MDTHVLKKKVCCESIISGVVESHTNIMDQYTREQQLRHLQQQHRREALRQQLQQHPSHPSHAQQQHQQQQQRAQSSQLPLNVFSNVPSVPREALRPQSQQQPMHPGPPIQSALQQLPAPIPSQLSAVPLSDTPPMTMPQVPQQQPQQQQQLQVLGSSEIGSIGSAELKQATRAMNAMGQAPLPPQARDVMLVAGATRPAELQAKVLKFVEAYLKPIDVTRLADLLDKNVHELEFTYSEGEMLVRRQRMDFLTGSLQTGSRQTLRETFEGPVSYLQMYDFITTIDAVYQNIRGLQQHVDALPQLRDSREIEFLKTHLLPSDYRPWPFHENDTIRAKTLKNIPDSATQFQHFGAQDSGQGLRLGDKTRFVLQDEHKRMDQTYENVNLSTQLVRDPITGARAKTPFELCCDEAALLDYPVLNALVAISQGLFRVTLVKARQLVAYADYTPKDIFELQLGPDNWTPELKQKIAALDTVPGAIAQYSQFEIPIGGWINTFANSSVAVAGARAKLQPKVTGLYNYPSNYLGSEYNRISGDSEGAKLHFAYQQSMPLHKLPSGGGAIGYHIVAKIANRAWAVTDNDKVVVSDEAVQQIAQDRKQKETQSPYTFVMSLLGSGPHFSQRSDVPPPQQQGELPVSSVLNVFTGPPPKVRGSVANDSGTLTVSNPNVLQIDYDAPYPDKPANNVIVTAKEHSLPEIHSVMELMRDHPIHACPRLAAALKQSGIHLLLLNEFLKVQCNFERELRQLRDTYISTSDPLAISQAVRSAPVWRECLRQADQELAAAEALKKN